MDRPLKLLIAAVAVVSAPLPAAAQAWPATVVAGAPQMTAQKRLPLTITAETYGRQSWSGAPTRPIPGARPALKLMPTHDLTDVPDVSIQAKDNWTDDEGFRVSPTKLAFKRRF